jgi:hypothetical protein
MARQEIAALIFLKRTRPSTDDAAGFFLTQMQFLPNTLNLFRFRQTNRAPAQNLKPARPAFSTSSRNFCPSLCGGSGGGTNTGGPDGPECLSAPPYLFPQRLAASISALWHSGISAWMYWEAEADVHHGHELQGWRR